MNAIKVTLGIFAGIAIGALGGDSLLLKEVLLAVESFTKEKSTAMI